jgi:hypothetical protein
MKNQINLKSYNITDYTVEQEIHFELEDYKVFIPFPEVYSYKDKCFYCVFDTAMNEFESLIAKSIYIDWVLSMEEIGQVIKSSVNEKDEIIKLKNKIDFNTKNWSEEHTRCGFLIASLFEEEGK